MKYTLPLNRNTLFRKAYQKGTSYANKYLAAYALKGNPKHNLLGITVSKKIGCAVKRNSVRRKIKESYRLNEEMLKTGYTIVIVARHASVFADYHDINSAFMHLMRKLNLLKSGDVNEPCCNSNN